MGRAAAIAFAKEGAKVVGCDVNAERGASAAAEVTKPGGEMVSVQPVDLCSPLGARQVAECAISQFGGVDILYNNAAMAYFEYFARMTAETFNRTIREEAETVFHLTREVWSHLIARAGGHIINTGYPNGQFGSSAIGALAHCTAKGGVLMFLRQRAFPPGGRRFMCRLCTPWRPSCGARSERAAARALRLLGNHGIGKQADLLA